ncbi:MAG: PAS domain S-box protein [Synergistaceae bacterium]|nr:PAS domain S-box protein [Synergistaceae bacterium]
MPSSQEDYTRIFDALLQDAQDAVALCDTNQVILKINPAFTELFGHSEEEAVGKRLDLLVATTPEMMASSDLQVDRIRTWEKVFTQAVLRTRKDGSTVPVSIEGNVFRLAGGESLILWNYREIHTEEDPGI